MSRKRYAPEFKEEAVRLVRDRDRPVAEVAERIGVSSHSLYKWVREFQPSKDEKRSNELLESKKEVQRLRAELRRAEEERDILKKAAAYFARDTK
jgi:transposase